MCAGAVTEELCQVSDERLRITSSGGILPFRLDNGAVDPYARSGVPPRILGPT